MALSNQQIKSKLEKPSKAGIITKAVKHENRLRFHTDISLDDRQLYIDSAILDFLNWVQQLIPREKYLIFLSLFRFPILTNELVEEIYSSLEKVFSGRNPYSNYEFSDMELEKDWAMYRKSELEENNRWKEEGWERMKTSINSFLIVDIGVEETNDRPAPYYYWLEIDNVIDYALVDNTQTEYIIFKQENNKIAVFDDETYRIFNIDKQGQITGEAEIEQPHELGYCPARLYWTTQLNSKVRDLKKSPISNQLSNLDWLAFFQYSKRHLDLYAPYPIYSGYEIECDYVNEETGEECKDGFIVNEDGKYRIALGGYIEKCPLCSTKRFPGVGSYFEIPIPSEENDKVDLRDPITIKTVDKASLDYNVSEVDRITSKIYQSVVGYGGDSPNDQAINEKQVVAAFESRTAVIVNLKKNFESAKFWTNTTIARLRYGKLYLGGTEDMGTDFYFLTAEALYKKYKTAKESGGSDIELDAIKQQIIQTENRNNPEALRRYEIIKHIEPYRHLTIKEIQELNSKGIISNEDLSLKINLIRFVDRFERENTDIVEFGKAIGFKEKIDIINKTFKSYGTQKQDGESN